MIYDIQKHAYLLARNSNKFWKDSDISINGYLNIKNEK